MKSVHNFFLYQILSDISISLPLLLIYFFISVYINHPFIILKKFIKVYNPYNVKYSKILIYRGEKKNIYIKKQT